MSLRKAGTGHHGVTPPTGNRVIFTVSTARKLNFAYHELHSPTHLSKYFIRFV
jgi:hypothetical protein